MKQQNNNYNMYDGVPELFSENKIIIVDNIHKDNKFNDDNSNDNMYDGIPELFSEYENNSDNNNPNDCIDQDNNSNDNENEDNNSNNQENNSNDNQSNENNSNENNSNENNSNENNSNENNSNNNNPNENNPNENNPNEDSIYEDSSDEDSETTEVEESNAPNDQGLFTSDTLYETRRLEYEQELRANIPQENLDAENLDYVELSELMLNAYDAVLDYYDERWNDNLEEMTQNLLEIVDRREALISSTDTLPVPQQVVNMAREHAYDFMVEMCINVYNLDLPSILGSLV